MLDPTAAHVEADDQGDHLMQQEVTPSLEVVLERRRDNLARALNLGNECLLVFSGHEIGIPGGLDTTYPLIEHPDFRWLSEQRGAGHVLAYDPDSGWQEFFRRPSMDDVIWMGAEWDGRGRPVEELAGWMAERADKTMVFLGQAPESFNGVAKTERPDIAATAWDVRRAKDPYAIEQIEKAIAATASGFRALRGFVEPGRSEREIAAELLYHFQRGGADALAFPTIVGTGNNSARLHFAPSERVVRRGDWILVDGGAAVNGYVGDVTRMFPPDRSGLSDMHRDLYAMLLGVQTAAIARALPGREWVDIHRETALDIARGLQELRIIKGTPEAAVETGAVGLFFPHGVGHMFGLGVRDASGHAPDRAGLEVVAMARPRCNFVLQPGYSMTIEPGCYFIPPYLRQHQEQGKFSDQVNYDLALGAWSDVGGIRIEDDIIIGKAGEAPRVLTAGIPK